METAEVTPTETASQFMVVWREFPTQRYLSLVINISDHVEDPKAFAAGYLMTYDGLVNFLGKSVPRRGYKNKEGFSLESVEKIEPDKTMLWRFAYEDFEDENTQDPILDVPVAEDPNVFFHKWMNDHMGLNEKGFSVCSISRFP